MPASSRQHGCNQWCSLTFPRLFRAERAWSSAPWDPPGTQLSGQAAWLLLLDSASWLGCMAGVRPEFWCAACSSQTVAGWEPLCNQGNNCMLVCEAAMEYSGTTSNASVQGCTADARPCQLLPNTSNLARPLSQTWPRTRMLEHWFGLCRSACILQSLEAPLKPSCC